MPGTAPRGHLRNTSPGHSGGSRCAPDRREAGGRRDSQLRSGDRLVAFFGLMYYAALRPSEAVDLRKDALSIPA